MNEVEDFMLGYKEDDIKFFIRMREELNRDLTMPVPIPIEHVRTVCRNGKDKPCMFLGVMGVNTCAKGTVLQDQVEVRHVLGQYKGKGNNCGGPPTFSR